MTKVRWIFACTVLLVVTLVVPSAWSQTDAVDPQALIGQWSGQGSLHQSMGRGKADSVRGDVTGNPIRYVGRASIIELTVREAQMTGTLSGQRNVRYSLMKEK